MMDVIRQASFRLIVCLGLAMAVFGCRRKDSEDRPVDEVRIGYFANLTHAQAVLADSSGEFADAVKPARLSHKVFNAGPSLIEALLAGEIDVGYVGPGPVLNAHAKGHGKLIRVISGSAANGVLIVARKGSGIGKWADLAGKRIASPQFGNTQDIAARYYLIHDLHQSGANNVLPIANADQAGMMKRNQIDVAWAPEPWGSRLVAAGAHVIGEEKDLWPDKEFALTLVITTPQFLEKHRPIVEKMLAVHERWTERLKGDPQKYVPQLAEALFALNGAKLPPGVLASSIKTIRFTNDPLPRSLQAMGDHAYAVEFSQAPADLAGLIDTSILQRPDSAGTGTAP